MSLVISALQPIGRLMTDYEFAQRLAANGRQTIEDGFRFGNRMKRITNVYEELLAKKD